MNRYTGWSTFKYLATSLLSLKWGDSVNNVERVDCTRRVQSHVEENLKSLLEKHGYPNGDISRCFDVNEYRYWFDDIDGLCRSLNDVSAYDEITNCYDGVYCYPQYLQEDELVGTVMKEMYSGDGFVLEVGCATGRFSQLFNNYIGIDPSAAMVKEAKRLYPDKEFCVASFESFYTDKQFDFIFADYGTPSYITPGYLEMSNSKLMDLLKPGGKYFLMYYTHGYFPAVHLGTISPELVVCRKDSYIKFGNYSVERGQKAL
ncbi:MAG: class I SAM-dependent methyltransferase [Planctomycetaceae bacterium]|jgi:SAM-dependent methyltransferase|nr:class I SAM-dependent methyltransferase [Planctomycetaceae bacterium]